MQYNEEIHKSSIRSSQIAITSRFLTLANFLGLLWLETKKHSGLSLLLIMSLRVGCLLLIDLPRKTNNPWDNSIWHQAQKNQRQLTYDWFFYGCSTVRSPFIQFLSNMRSHLFPPDGFICIWDFHLLVKYLGNIPLKAQICVSINELDLPVNYPKFAGDQLLFFHNASNSSWSS